MPYLVGLIVSWLVVASPSWADESKFDPDTGLRIHHYTETTPQQVPGGTRIELPQAHNMWNDGALFVDVLSITQGRYDELDGTWPDHPPRDSIPGAIWLPNVGFGRPAQDMQEYFRAQVSDAVGDGQSIVVFCVADCWMGWNAVQHLAQMGFSDLYWFADGTTAWEAAGYALERVEPMPVEVD